MSDKPVLVIDAGPYSLSRTGVAGVGLRLAEVTQVLSHRYRVRVIVSAEPDTIDLGEAETVDTGTGARKAIREADAVVFFDSADRDRLELAASQRKLIIGECRAPIEHLDFPSLLAQDDPTGEHQRYLMTYRRQLQVTHHFLCRSQVERVSLLSTLCAFGRIRPSDVARSRTLDHLITTVPIGFSRRSLLAADAVEPVLMAEFLWTGGVWAFYQPTMLVEAVHLLRERGIDTTAAFMYASPIADTRSTLAKVADEIERLGVGDRVFLNDQPLALDERDQYLKAALGYVCVTQPGAENETTARLRLRDTWLHGTPTIIDPFGHSGELVVAEGLGIVLREPDARSLADAMQEVKSGAMDRPGRRMERLYETTLTGFTEWLDEALSAN